MVPGQVPPHPSGHVAPVQVVAAQEQFGTQQGCVLQLWVGAGPGHGAPPPDGTGLSQFCVCVPPPQVTEHGPHVPQPPLTPQARGLGMEGHVPPLAGVGQSQVVGLWVPFTHKSQHQSPFVGGAPGQLSTKGMRSIRLTVYPERFFGIVSIVLPAAQPPLFRI